MADGKRLGRAKLAKIKSLPRAERRARVAPPDLPAVEAIVELLDPALRELVGLLGDERTAQRVARLQGEFPLASVPELVVYDWLGRQQIPFTFQGSLFGGRAMKGGAVPDFVVNDGGRGLVWRVQGTYWHTQPGARNKDLIEKLRMLGAEFDGLRIEAVVDLWEEDIYRRRPEIFRLALAGVGLRD